MVGWRIPRSGGQGWFLPVFLAWLRIFFVQITVRFSGYMFWVGRDTLWYAKTFCISPTLCSTYTVFTFFLMLNRIGRSSMGFIDQIHQILIWVLFASTRADPTVLGYSVPVALSTTTALRRSLLSPTYIHLWGGIFSLEGCSPLPPPCADADHYPVLDCRSIYVYLPPAWFCFPVPPDAHIQVPYRASGGAPLLSYCASPG